MLKPTHLMLLGSLIVCKYHCNTTVSVWTVIDLFILDHYIYVILTIISEVNVGSGDKTVGEYQIIVE